MDQMRETTDRAIFDEYTGLHSEYKKPYKENDFAEMESLFFPDKYYDDKGAIWDQAGWSAASNIRIVVNNDGYDQGTIAKIYAYVTPFVHGEEWQWSLSGLPQHCSLVDVKNISRLAGNQAVVMKIDVDNSAEVGTYTVTASVRGTKKMLVENTKTFKFKVALGFWWLLQTSVGSFGVVSADVAIDPNSDMHVALIVRRSIGGNNQDWLYHLKYEEATGALTTSFVASDTSSIGSAQIVMVGSVPNIFYVEQHNGTTDNRLRRAYFSGGSWTYETLDSGEYYGSGDVWRLAACVDSLGYLHLIVAERAWSGSWTYHLQHRTNSSGSWQSENIATGEDWYAVAVAILSDDSMVVLAMVNATTYYKVDCYEGSWGSWTDSGTLGNSEKEFACVAVDSSDHAYVKFVQNGAAEVWETDNSGGSFSQAAQSSLTITPSAINAMALAIDTDDNQHLFLQVDSEIWYAAFADGGPDQWFEEQILTGLTTLGRGALDLFTYARQGAFSAYEVTAGRENYFRMMNDEFPVPTPVPSPAAGNYNNNQTITLLCACVGETIYYTTDGSAPDNNSTQYSAPIDLPDDATTTIKAIAYVGDEASDIGSAEYTVLDPATPTFSPSAGTYTTGQTCTISCTTPGVTIYYTTDGSTPDSGDTEYAGAFALPGGDTTVKAIAIIGSAESSIGQAAYTIPATPVMDPVGGTYDNGQTVTLTCATAGSTIYYTTDGSTPDNGDTEYTGAISLPDSDTTTIKAIAYVGSAYGAVESQEYTTSASSWTAYHDNTKWTAWTGSWDSGNSEWDAANVGYYVVDLGTSGSWPSGFRPTKVRITHDLGGAIDMFRIQDTSSNYVVDESDYTSGTEINLSLSNDINTLYVRDTSGAFSITNIEFYA